MYAKSVWTVFLASLALALSIFSQAQTANQQVLITVDQRIEAATRALGYFDRSHSYRDFRVVIDTLSEVNGPDRAAAPLNTYDWRIRQTQIKDTFSAWFLIFRTLDAAKIPNCNSLDGPNPCYSYLAVQEHAASNAAQQHEFETNAVRCERNKFQFLLSRMDTDTQIGLHDFLARLTDSEYEGSDFAYELGKSDLTAERSAQMWSIYASRDQAAWKPTTAVTQESASASPVLDETTPAKAVDGHLIEWLQGSTPRLVAWAAYYVGRDKWRKAVPAMLAYVHTHAFDTAFQMGAEFSERLTAPVRDSVDPMLAVVDALIGLRAHVPTGDLLQIAPVLPTHVLVAALIPNPREELLYTIYLNGGLRSGEWQLYPRSEKDSGEGTLRWVTAGDMLASLGYRPFVADLFHNFTLVLHFTVVRPDSLLMGNAVFPGCSFIKDQPERDSAWPPVGSYILSASAPSAQYNLGAPPVAASQQVAYVEGAPAIFVERYTSRFYGAVRECGFGAYRKSWLQANWLEKLGIGEFPKTHAGGVQITAGLVAYPETLDDPRFFSFTRLFKPKSEADYPLELKRWLAHDGDVYENILHGLRSRRLVDDLATPKPLQIHIYGLDFRKPVVPGGKQAITEAPFPDLTPSNTEISWKTQ